MLDESSHFRTFSSKAFAVKPPMQPGPLFVVGVIVGLAIGVAFGISIGNVAFGMPIGAMLGVLIGAVMNKAGNDGQQ